MVKGAKAPSSSGAPGKTQAANAASKGGKGRQQEEKTIDESVSHLLHLIPFETREKHKRERVRERESFICKKNE